MLNVFMEECVLNWGCFPHLVDSFLHLHQAQVGQGGLYEVHYGLQAIVLQDQRLVAAQQAQGDFKDNLWALEEQHIW